MHDDNIENLIKLYFSNTITEIQKEQLIDWIVQSSDKQIGMQLEKVWTDYKPDTRMPDDVSDKLIASFFKTEIPQAKVKKVAPIINIHHYEIKWWQIATAAACIIIFITGAYFWPLTVKNNSVAKSKVQKRTILNDIKPGGQKALLTLADGTQIMLDSASTGVLAQQGNTRIVKLSNGKITYNTNGMAANEILYNTMATPMGGMYQLILPDGSKVWLNAASSIRYPTEFGGKERRVQITGEAYFEVAKNAALPFIVKINNDAEIKVLGTHFNVNAYDDETEIKTTLLEGAVKISQHNNTSSLKPGQQAQINKIGSIKIINNADLEEAVAWQKGNFQFNSANLPAVLQQAAKWYNLEIEYQGKITTDKFTGKISRSVGLSSFLKWMQWSDVHFKIEGKKLIVLP